MPRTFFIYVEEKSPLLKLHPLLKISSLLAINLLAWIIDSPVILLSLTITLLLAFKLFKIPLARIRKFIVFAILIVQAVMLSYLLGSTIPGNIVFYRFPWGAYISDMTLVYAFTMIMKFLLMLWGSTLLLAVMRDTDIVYGLISMKIPYYLAFTVNLAFRLSTVFLEDYAKVRDAMILRGTSFSEKSIVQRARNYVRLGTPLMVLAIRRMFEMTNTLIIKGFDPSRKRSHLYDFNLTIRDKALLLLISTTVFLTFLLKTLWGLFTFPGWPFNG